MPTLTIGFLLCSFEYKEKFLNKNKQKFKNIFFIASKNDWNLIFSVGKTKKVTPEELERFEKKLNGFYKQIKPLLEKYKLYKNPDVITILNRIKNLKEEYINYPLPNRELFFDLRLDFYLQQLRKAALNKSF
jgi:hypothetical protein